MARRLAVLGDSIGAGMGADRAGDTLAPLLAAALSTDGRVVESRVFAVSGARSGDLAAQVERARSWRPDLAMVVIGANDLIHQVPADQAARALGGSVAALRALGAQVVVLPAPDLSFMPQVPEQMRGPVQAQAAMLRAAQVAATLDAGGRLGEVDPRTTAAFAREPSLFCGDRFHPSSRGYALIARSLASAVRDAADASAGEAPDMGSRAPTAT